MSLYNETQSRAILPTPAIGGIGLLDIVSQMATLSFKAPGEDIVLIGSLGTHLGQSLYLREIHGVEGGPPPPVDLAMEKRTGDLVRQVIRAKLATACHDLSDGGLIVALIEMAIAGNVGCTITLPDDSSPAALFGEDQARYLLTCPPGQTDSLLNAAETAGIPAFKIGRTGGDELKVG